MLSTAYTSARVHIHPVYIPQLRGVPVLLHLKDKRCERVRAEPQHGLRRPLRGRSVWDTSCIMANDLLDFMAAATTEMADEYERIQKRATEDPGTAGDQGEENWATLLRRWLPSYFHIVTKGRILSHHGIASPQVDMLVLSPAYPKHLLDKKLYLAGGVEAAFECKTTLKAAHIATALKNAAEIRTHLPERKGSPYRELRSPIIYGLLAHSHSWKSAKSSPIENTTDSILRGDLEYISHPREMLDLVCVADLATWSGSKLTFIGPSQHRDDPLSWEPMKSIYGEHGSAVTSYMCHSFLAENQADHFTPVGAMLGQLFTLLAWEHQDMRKIEQYFRLANLQGSGAGRMRLWSIDIYSDEIRDRVEAGYLTNGVEWDEWSVGFA